MPHNHHHPLPCLQCYPHSYIRMVQNLIERCLIMRMSQNECVVALATHARIQPLVTLTVWKELHKANIGFFESYLHATAPRPFNCGPFQKVTRFRRKNFRK